MSESVDLHAVRHRLKLVRDAGELTLFENRGDVPCPVCGGIFEEALATSERSRRLTPDRKLAFCLLREDERLIIFTHAPETLDS